MSRINEASEFKKFEVTETTGNCKNWKKCRSINVTLGNDLCMECWDRGLSGRMYRNIRKERPSKVNLTKVIRLHSNGFYQI